MGFMGAFRASDCLVAFFLATLPLYPPSLSAFCGSLPEAGGVRGVFDLVMLAAALVVGGLLMAACIRSRGGVSIGVAFVRASVAALLGGYGLLLANAVLEGAGGLVLAVVGSVLLGVASVILCVAWGSRLAAYGLRGALFVCALAVGLSSLLDMLLGLLPEVVSLVLFFVFAAAGAVPLCLRPACDTLDGQSEEPRELDEEIEHLTSSTHAGTHVGTAVSSIARMAQVAGLPFVGLLIFAFAASSSEVYTFGMFRIESVGGLLAMVAMLPLVLVRRDRPLMPFVYRMVLPFLSLVLMMFGVLPKEAALKSVGLMGTYVLLAAVVVIALASLCAMAHAREFSPVLIFSTSVVCFAVVSLVGTLCELDGLFEGDSGGLVMLFLTTLYFAAILLARLLQAWRRDESESRAGVSVGAELKGRSELVAKEGGLTPRETEVLSYLGRGYGIAYTANALVISESTVRTHVRNIYRKLGVSSREELLQLIDRMPYDASDR